MFYEVLGGFGVVYLDSIVEKDEREKHKQEEGREGGRDRTWMFSKCSVVLVSSTSMASSKMTRGSRTKRWAMCLARAASTPPSRSMV